MESLFWVIWSIAVLFAFIGWITISTVVRRVVRRVVLLVPLEQKFSAGASKLAIPLTELEHAESQLESAIVSEFRFPPIRWLVRRAVKSESDWFLGSIRAFCAGRGATVIDGPVFGAWMHEVVAGKIGEFAGDAASALMRVLFFVLCVIGAFAYFWFR